MLEIRTKKMYSQIYGVLRLLGNKYIKLLPREMYSLICNNKMDGYDPTYNKAIPLYKQDISKDAISFLCMLEYKYWCNNDRDKQRIKNILSNNEGRQRAKYFNYFNKK